MKTRHTKHMLMKYSGDVYDEAVKYYEDNRKAMSTSSIFENIPYIGIFYTPITSEYNELWVDTDRFDIMLNNVEHNKVKVLCVNSDYTYIALYDDHNKDLILRKIKSNKYVVVGNVIRLKEKG